MKLRRLDNSYQNNFQGKKFLSKTSLLNLKTILHNMNSETVYEGRERTFSSTLVTRVGLKKQPVSISDQRLLMRPVNNKSNQMRGNALLSIGRIKLVIDNSTGEIVKSEKPFYKPWFVVLKSLETALNTISSNFDNADIVTKSRLTISGFTQKGVELLNKASKSVKYNKI